MSPGTEAVTVTTPVWGPNVSVARATPPASVVLDTCDRVLFPSASHSTTTPGTGAPLWSRIDTLSGAGRVARTLSA